jgi:A/G-specific adenine glycosylase
VTAVSRALTAWFRKGHRDLPWRHTTDPYSIWVSEIMLQQTRAQAVIPYYLRFLERFPTVEALAAAEEAEVLTLWSGLGYYSRARNLRRAAREIVSLGGFPRSYQQIRSLPGIGDYTAAAVASIAFELPHAVLDGNVLRVIARVQNDFSDIAAIRTRDRFREIAQGWLDARRPGLFNQALMELGATVCLPRNPLCLLCPVASLCQARQSGTATELPVKRRKVIPERIEASVLIIWRGTRLLLRQRAPNAGRMAGFWELPGPDDLTGVVTGEVLGAIRHTITHHHYSVQVCRAKAARSWRPPANFRWFPEKELGTIPLTTIARKSLRLADVGIAGRGQTPELFAGA